MDLWISTNVFERDHERMTNFGKWGFVHYRENGRSEKREGKEDLREALTERWRDQSRSNQDKERMRGREGGKEKEKKKIGEGGEGVEVLCPGSTTKMISRGSASSSSSSS